MQATIVDLEGTEEPIIFDSEKDDFCAFLLAWNDQPSPRSVRFNFPGGYTTTIRETSEGEWVREPVVKVSDAQ